MEKQKDKVKIYELIWGMGDNDSCFLITDADEFFINETIEYKNKEKKRGNQFSDLQIIEYCLKSLDYLCIIIRDKESIPMIEIV